MTASWGRATQCLQRGRRCDAGRCGATAAPLWRAFRCLLLLELAVGTQWRGDCSGIPLERLVTVEFFRDFANASVSEYCYVSLVGHWTS